MKSFSTGELNVDVQVRHSDVTMTWRGQCSARDPGTLLSPPLGEILAGITDAHSVTLDFRLLEYMNSSSIRPVLTFLQSVAAKARAVRVTYAVDKNWQRLSFMSMRAVLASKEKDKVVFDP